MGPEQDDTKALGNERRASAPETVKNLATERQYVDQDPRESERNLHIRLENSMEGFYSSTVDGILLEYSEQFARILRFNATHHVSAQPALLWELPEQRQEYTECLLQQGFVRDFELKARCADGQPIDLMVSARLVCDPEGHPARIEGSVLDITARKRTEERLRTSLELLRVAANVARFGGWSVDLQSDRCVWSDAVADIHEMPRGYGPSVKDGIEFYAPEWRDRIRQVFSDCVQQGIPYDEELEIVTRFGKRVWVRTVGAAVRDADGRVIRVQGAFQDVNRRKKAELARQKTEERLKLTLQATHDGVWDWDIPRNEVTLSPSYYAILGYEEGEFPSTLDAQIELVHPEDRERFRQERARCLQEGVPVRVEFRMRTQTGHWRWILSRGMVVERDASGQPVRMVGTHTDITEQKQAEEAIGLQLQELKRWQALMWHQSDRSQALKREVNELLACLGEPARYPSVNGSCADAETPTTVQGFADEAERSRRALLDALEDWQLSEKRELALQEQLMQAQKMESIGRLAGGVAHDFNNLVCVIVSYAGLVLDSLQEGDPLRADLEEIRNSGERAATLTRQLLAFSRRQLLAPEVLNPNQAIAGIEGMLRRLLGEDIVIDVKAADDLGNVMVDPGQFEQLIMNLAVNARDAMPGGGRLTIETANAVVDEQDVHAQALASPGQYVLLSVIDQGCGMDAETKARIFEPFFTTKAKGRGTGLGLSTVYGIVKQSGGNIAVSSELEQGTCFKIYLPRVDDPATVARRKPETSLTGGQETVLLVEDEDSVRKLAERILRSAGYQVLVAAGSGEALLLFEKYGEAVSLLVTDVVMPEMSGRALADRLLGQDSRLKVLFMSGYADDAIVDNGILVPGTHFIGKPFTAAELTRKVRETLDAEGQ